MTLPERTAFTHDRPNTRPAFPFTALVGQALLQPITHAEMIPHVIAQKLLQRSHRRAASQGDRLNTLARQVREQASTIGVQVINRTLLNKTIGKQPQVSGEGRSQCQQFFWRHAAPPCRVRRLYRITGSWRSAVVAL